MKRRTFIKRFVMGIGWVYAAPILSHVHTENSSADITLESYQPDIIPVPDDKEQWESFRKALIKWKKEKHTETQYDDNLYNNNEFKWAASSFNCYFLMMYDMRFYDHTKNEYTVDKFLDMVTKDFGRIDSVVLWHAYPRIGLDERNQFDFYREMPGGLEGIRKISDYLHSKDIQVFINYNPWDTGTRRENIDDIDGLTTIIKEIDADGIFLDTMQNASPDFREKLDAVKRGVVLESELALPVESICDHHLSWAQWFSDSTAPGILRNKWFEPRHIQHGISRWSLDKTKDIHTAWMNGSGVMIWENIFGQWLEWSNRDKFLMRLLSPIQKKYSEIFTEGEWIPMSDKNLPEHVYSNLWIKEDIRLWTLVNRSEEKITGELLHIKNDSDFRYFDLIKGEEIFCVKKGKLSTAEGELLPRGIGCYIAVNKKKITSELSLFLSSQKQIYQHGLKNSDSPIISIALKPITHTKAYKDIPENMVKIPSIKTVQERIFTVREIGYYDTLDKSFENAVYPGLHYPTTKIVNVDIQNFVIDETPVTNHQFDLFLKSSGYKPLCDTNFLRHWNSGRIPEGKENHPVVYIDLNDARAYARWAGKRLPTEEEWQFAAQGPNNNKYPWGNEPDNNKYNVSERTTSVHAFPQGKSDFGCIDMCGNVWELTESEYEDGRNHFCILKGGSFYKAMGSDWYFDGGIQPCAFSGKQLLIYPGLDRCSTIGFRCVVDIQ